MPHPSPQVLWLPAHPTEGSTSMDRHWRELAAIRDRQASPGPIEVGCLLTVPPPARSLPAAKLPRTWHKYVGYPLAVRRRTRGRRRHLAAVHLLDHSFAHLLPHVAPGVRRLVTVHDLAPLRTPGVLSARQQQRFARVVAHLPQADLLLAVSEFSAQDLAQEFPASADKIRVLPMGVAVEHFATPRPAPDWWLQASVAGTRRVVCSVGSALPRKNLELFPALFAHARAAGAPPLAFVRIGQKLPAALAERLRELLGPEGLTERGDVSDEELVATYQHADALVFPSRLEGFGLPLLEAMAAGCPVLSSNASSLPEVGGPDGQAIGYFDPDDAESAGRQLSALLTEPGLRAARVTAGHRRADEFSWQRHYQRLLALYADGV